jgi:hypothetical protein
MPMDSRSNSRRRLYPASKDLKRWIGCEPFFEPMGLVRQIVILTTQHRWSVGCGPGGVSYGKCADDFGLSSKIFCELLPGFPGEGY